MHQEVLVESAVGVCDEGPRHAVNPGQASQRLVQQDRQAAKVAARQPVVNLLELRFNQVKVVQ